MTTVNKIGYLTRNKKTNPRNWWLVKHHLGRTNTGSISLNTITFPKQYIGKKVRFKVEIMEGETL